jgi:hypothetical protein
VKQHLSRTPVASFPIPAHAPDEVAAAADKFDRIATAWAEAKGALDDARAGAKAAVINAADAAAQAVVDGKKARDPDAVAAEVAAAVAVAERKVATLATATHLAGNELADAIAANKQEWLPLIERVEAAAAARYGAAVAEAREALKDLAPCRRAVEWLQGFNAGEAKIGAINPFTGGRIVVDGNTVGPLRGELNPDELLQVAGKAAERQVQPGLRHHREAAASSLSFRRFAA